MAHSTLAHVPPSEKICETMRAKSDTVLLAFSCGKDALGAWIQLRRYFPKIIPFFMYFVPGLQFVEDDLNYYEEFFKAKIIRVPAPTIYRLLNGLVFQPPERIPLIRAADLPEIEREDVIRLLREDLNLSKDTYTATGVRAADSPVRHMAVKKYGAITHSRKSFFPVWDWNKERLLRELKQSGVKLGTQYKWFGRSFDGVDFRFIEPLKRMAPADYKLVLQWYPLAEVELLRREYAKTKV